VKDVQQLLIQSVTDYAIYAFDEDGLVTTWNPGAQKLKGYSPAEIIGQHFSRFYTAEDREIGKPAQLLQRAIAAGHVQDEGWRVRKDGSKFWASVLISAMRDSSGALVGLPK
jgi:PAS domain S-box-containing protein